MKYKVHVYQNKRKKKTLFWLMMALILKYINDNTESDHKVTLSENDHQDLVEIFKNIFSDCSTKMSNLLMSQKMAL